MTLRVGFLSVAHMHAHGYAHALRERDDVFIMGVWDHLAHRAEHFSQKWEITVYPEPEDLIARCDAVVIASENRRHAEHIEWAATQGKAILCEKPLATTAGEANRIRRAVESSHVLFMTSLPCRLSPVYQAFHRKLQDGVIGDLLALWGTNHGTCPFDWFVQPEESGGGAFMDHVVHVADLFRDLIGTQPESVYAQRNSLRLGLPVEDTAFLHLSFPDGRFATLDGSWSRPPSYKTWGDVRLSATGTNGVLEADLFLQALDFYGDQPSTHREVGFGSSLDTILVREFLDAIHHQTEPPITLDHGLAASAVAIAAAASAENDEPVTVPAL